MTKARVMIADSDSVSAPQLMDFFRKVGDGTIDGALFQQFLRNPRRFGPETTTLVRAANILTPQGVKDPHVVVTNRQAGNVWGAFVRPIPVRYSEATLRACAEENRRGNADWRLIFIFGLSLHKQLEIVGTDVNEKLYFYGDDSWWFDTAKHAWASKRPRMDYYLLDFRGRFGETSWHEQEKLIASMRPFEERAYEAVVSEAVFTVFAVYGERLLGDWIHWGRSVDPSESDLYRIGIDFGEVGVGVSRFLETGSQHPGLRVVLAQKFDS